VSRIAMPSSASKQGFAFEHLILSHFQKSGRYQVREWSSYLHGKSGKWYQCDGIIEDGSQRWLVEAKFFKDRPATVRDVRPREREQAARDMDCDGILYVSLSGFDHNMRSWPHDSSLTAQFLTWDDIRKEVLSGIEAHASVLLDAFKIKGSAVTSLVTDSLLRFNTLSRTPLAPSFPEFVTFPDGVERWVRRLPKLALQRDQMCRGEFRYQELTEAVCLIAERLSDLSLEEAWRVEDSLSGYAARVYSAVKATAQAMRDADGGFVEDVQLAIRALGWKTGIAGVRSSLDQLVLLDLVQKETTAKRRVRYHLTPFGWAYIAQGTPNDDLFAEILRAWPPYAQMRRAILEQGIAPQPRAVAGYFKAQYAPYEPYAKCLFNENKTYGLIKLYQRFG
jgi:hypothetical protein